MTPMTDFQGTVAVRTQLAVTGRGTDSTSATGSISCESVSRSIGRVVQARIGGNHVQNWFAPGRLKAMDGPEEDGCHLIYSSPSGVPNYRSQRTEMTLEQRFDDEHKRSTHNK